MPDALVEIADGPVPMPELAVVVDATGRFTLRLPRGRFRLRAHGPDGATGDAEVEVGGAPDAAGTGETVITIGPP